METKEPEQKPQSHHSMSLIVWAIVLVLLVVFGSAFWWMPRFLPNYTKTESCPPADKPEALPTPNLDELKQDTATLKSEITALREQMRQAEQKPTIVQNFNVPLLTAFMDLKIAIRFGSPYERELARLKKITTENTAPLDDYASYGIPKLSYLVAQFKACMEELRTPASIETDHSFWDKVKTKLGSLVKITKVKPEDTAAADPWNLAPILNLLKQGDVNAALLQLNQKSMLENKSIQSWKIHAEVYVNAEKKLDDLMQKLFMADQK